MLKKLAFAVIIFTAGETVAYYTVNRAAKQLSSLEDAPVAVLVPQSVTDYIWVDLNVDPTKKHRTLRQLFADA